MSPEKEVSFADQLQASVVKFLYDTEEHDAASAVLSCKLDVHMDMDDDWWYVTLSAPASVYEQYRRGIFYDEAEGESLRVGSFTDKVRSAFQAFNSGLVILEVQAKMLDIDDPDWKGALQRLLTGDTKANQGLTSEKSAYHKYWQGMHFGSASELEIAKALDRKGVMYFPGCLARVGAPETRSNKEPDFLVCYQGKWGILEVDGKPFHPPERTAQEHERGRQFKYHGVKVVEHFDADFCREQPDTVVNDFLKILEQS